jgi:hypothetical protein
VHQDEAVGEPGDVEDRKAAHADSPQRGRPWPARVALVLAGTVAVLLTPPFALAYYRAYAPPSERPRAWLAALREPLQSVGALDGDPVSTYERYGTAYGLTLLVVLLVLVTHLRPRRRAGMGELVGAATGLFGLAVLTVGTLAEYAVGATGTGFTLELVGSALLAVCTPVLGVALLRRRRVTLATGLTVAAAGPVGVTAGLWAVGHIPSGPGLVVAAAALAVGTARTAQRRP